MDLFGKEQKPLTPRVHPDDKAFKLPVGVKAMQNGKSIAVRLPLGASHGDQGSDINLVSAALARALRLNCVSLSNGGWSGLTMNTAVTRQRTDVFVLHHDGQPRTNDENDEDNTSVM